MSLRRLLSEPLLQFIVLGLGFFALYLVVRDETSEEDQQIVVSVKQIEQLSALWQKQLRRPPTQTELAGLVESHVREEVLYREAKSF